MKDYKDILDFVYTQPEINEEQSVFADYTTEQKLAVETALAEIWGEAEYSFRHRKTTFNTVDEQREYDLPFGRIERNGLKESTSTSAMTLIQNADNLSDTEGRPYYYYVEAGQLCLYPVPDAVYSIAMKYYTNYMAMDSTDTEKAMLEDETDVLNIPEELEYYFINALAAKTIMNKMNDDTDEIYRVQAMKYANNLRLLKNQATRTHQNLEFIV